MRYLYILLICLLLVRGCYPGQEYPQTCPEAYQGYTACPFGDYSKRQTARDDTPRPLSRREKPFGSLWEFIASVIGISAGTYLATRKIRILLNNGLTRLNGKQTGTLRETVSNFQHFRGHSCGSRNQVFLDSRFHGNDREKGEILKT